MSNKMTYWEWEGRPAAILESVNGTADVGWVMRDPAAGWTEIDPGAIRATGRMARDEASWREMFAGSKFAEAGLKRPRVRLGDLLLSCVGATVVPSPEEEGPKKPTLWDWEGRPAVLSADRRRAWVLNPMSRTPKQARRSHLPIGWLEVHAFDVEREGRLVPGDDGKTFIQKSIEQRYDWELLTIWHEIPDLVDGTLTGQRYDADWLEAYRSARNEANIQNYPNRGCLEAVSPTGEMVRMNYAEKVTYANLSETCSKFAGLRDAALYEIDAARVEAARLEPGSVSPRLFDWRDRPAVISADRRHVWRLNIETKTWREDQAAPELVEFEGCEIAENERRAYLARMKSIFPEDALMAWDRISDQSSDTESGG